MGKFGKSGRFRRKNGQEDLAPIPLVLGIGVVLMDVAVVVDVVAEGLVVDDRIAAGDTGDE
jgi:hypothetical protein